MGKKKHKHQGHYCKMCGEYKSNESFSGKGHRLHICKKCISIRNKAKKEKKRLEHDRINEVSEENSSQAHINLGLQRECAKFMQSTKDFMNKNASAEDAHDAYLKLYDKVYQFDKHIARRYDGMSGGRYYITVCYLYYDGVLTDEDIREFDDELYNSLKEAKKSFQN